MSQWSNILLLENVRKWKRLYFNRFMREVASIQTEASRVHTASMFVRALISESRQGMAQNDKIRVSIVNELKRQDVDINSLQLEKAWELFDKKLLRPRPRLLGAIGAYAMLTDQKYQAVVEQGGMNTFKSLWALAAIQDDLIDDLDRQQVSSMDERGKEQELRNSIFGKDKVFYRSAYKVIINELRSDSRYGPAELRYITANMAYWFRFLIKQESEVFSTSPQDHTFDFSRKYREEQDYTIARVLTICLNGVHCLDPKYQEYEGLLPFLSYRSQIIDDIADTPEDLTAGRPSYTVGALHSHPEELKAIETMVNLGNIQKMTPQHLKKVAPRSYALVRNAYDEYGEWLVEKYGVPGQILDFAGRVAYWAFPIMRDIMHRVNDRYANF